jgi:hypothetical protein
VNVLDLTDTKKWHRAVHEPNPEPVLGEIRTRSVAPDDVRTEVLGLAAPDPVAVEPGEQDSSLQQGLGPLERNGRAIRSERGQKGDGRHRLGAPSPRVDRMVPEAEGLRDGCTAVVSIAACEVEAKRPDDSRPGLRRPPTSASHNPSNK